MITLNSSEQVNHRLNGVLAQRYYTVLHNEMVALFNHNVSLNDHGSLRASKFSELNFVVFRLLCEGSVYVL